MKKIHWWIAGSGALILVSGATAWYMLTSTPNDNNAPPAPATIPPQPSPSSSPIAFPLFTPTIDKSTPKASAKPNIIERRTLPNSDADINQQLLGKTGGDDTPPRRNQIKELVALFNSNAKIKVFCAANPYEEPNQQTQGFETIFCTKMDAGFSLKSATDEKINRLSLNLLQDRKSVCRLALVFEDAAKNKPTTPDAKNGTRAIFEQNQSFQFHCLDGAGSTVVHKFSQELKSSRTAPKPKFSPPQL
ncbi:MAG: hypothetical protein ACOYK8_06030 [Alphaproteobacteria bacterium]